MKSITMIALYLWSFSAFAKFEGVTNTTINSGPDQSGCAAEDIIRNEYKRTSIDIIGKAAAYKWSCDGVTSKNFVAKRCPSPQYVEGNENNMKDLECYSNSSSGSAICVSKASSKVIEEAVHVHDESLKGSTARARFKELFMLEPATYGNSNSRDDRSYHMDAEGCQVEIYRSYSGNPISYEQCADLFSSVMNGKKDKYSKDKFCDANLAKNPSQILSNARVLKSLGECFQGIPNFESRYLKSLEPKSSSRDKSSDPQANKQ